MWFSFSGFSGFVPQVPIQVLAVTGSASGASVVFHSHVAASLLADGTNLASKLFAKFQTTSSQFQHQGKFKTLVPLLRTVTEWGLEPPVLASRIPRPNPLGSMEVKELGKCLRPSLPPYPRGNSHRKSRLCFSRCLHVLFVLFWLVLSHFSLFCLLFFSVGAFAAFFNEVWEKKRDSEMAYQKFLSEQQLRQAKKKQQVSVRRRHDPLPEPPSKKATNIEDEINRRRSLNRHDSGSPKHIYQLPKEALDDSDINPYAVFEKETPVLPGYSSVEAVKHTNHSRDSEGSDDLVPYATSTPNALFLTLQKGGALPGSTPPNNEPWQKREFKTEDLYAKVDLSRKRSFRKSKELAMNDSEVNLIENTLYANANLVQKQKSARETPPATLEVPPPIPQRKYNVEEDFPPADSGTDTLRSNCDEGYNTFRTDDNKEENHYAVVADLQPMPTSVSKEDPYALRVREKIQLFNSKMLPKQDIWVKMDARQEKSKEIYSSVPELNKQGSDVEAPLAQQEVCVHACSCFIVSLAEFWPRSLTVKTRRGNIAATRVNGGKSKIPTDTLEKQSRFAESGRARWNRYCIIFATR